MVKKKKVKVKKSSKKIAKKKKIVKAKVKKVTVKKVKTEKVLGIVDHFFGHISVAAIKIKAPVKVGDYIRIKGYTTDFIQKVDSMQIEHESVLKVKKGDDVGIRVNGKVRSGDKVLLSTELPQSIENIKPISFSAKPASKPDVRPQPKPEYKPSGENYNGVKFIKF